MSIIIIIYNSTPVSIAQPICLCSCQSLHVPRGASPLLQMQGWGSRDYVHEGTTTRVNWISSQESGQKRWGCYVTGVVDVHSSIHIQFIHAGNHKCK